MSDNGDDMLYKKLTLVIFTKVKDHFCRNFTVFKRDSLAMQRQNLDPNVLKPLLFNGFIKHFKYILPVSRRKNK